MDQIFLVLVHVALENVFNGPQKSFERITFDRNNPAIGFSFHAGLPDGILDEGDFSEVVALLVLEDLLERTGGTFLLLSDQLSL